MARCRYRDHSGRVFWPERYGSTKGEAERRLLEALRDWIGAEADGDFGPNTRIRMIEEEWIRYLENEATEGNLSWSTYDRYKQRLTQWVMPAIGELTAREVEAAPRKLDRLVTDVRKQTSAANARTVKTVVSALCAYAIRLGAMSTNPARQIGRVKTPANQRQIERNRSLKKAEVLDLLGKLDADEAALNGDLPDLVRQFLATGERTGEVLAARWPDFDPKRKEIAVSGNAVRTSRGLIVNEGKTPNSLWPIALPDWGVQMLNERRAKLEAVGKFDPEGLIYPSSTGTIREPSNIYNRHWGPFRTRAGYPWVTFRTFRKTVATLLDESGLSAREIADVLRHAKPSMTLDVYMGRRVTSRASAKALHQVISPAKRGGTIFEEVPIKALTCTDECPRCDSNAHWTDFESAASADWATGAFVVSIRDP